MCGEMETNGSLMERPTLHPVVDGEYDDDIIEIFICGFFNIVQDIVQNRI